MAKPTTVNTAVLPQAFREALQADLAEQHNATTAEPSRWTTLRDAVAVCTRQMRTHGYYPEQVLVAIKSAVCDAAITVVAEDLVTEIVHDAAQSCIRAYFEPDIDQRVSVDGPPQGVRVPTGVETPGTTQSPSSLGVRGFGAPVPL